MSAVLTARRPPWTSFAKSRARVSRIVPFQHLSAIAKTRAPEHHRITARLECTYILNIETHGLGSWLLLFSAFCLRRVAVQLQLRPLTLTPPAQMATLRRCTLYSELCLQKASKLSLLRSEI
jgi:hypothetical protein